MSFLRSFCLVAVGACQAFFLGLAAQSNCRAAEAVPEKPSAKAYVEFGDRHFDLASTSDKKDLKLREYVLTGEKIGHWNELMSVRVFPEFSKEVGVDGFLESTAAAVETSNSAARYVFLKDKNTGQIILDFMTFDDKPEAIAEWNLLRADYVDGKGLVVHQYARRYYMADADKAQGEKIGKDILSRREATIELFEKADFQEKRQ